MTKETNVDSWRPLQPQVWRRPLYSDTDSAEEEPMTIVHKAIVHRVNFCKLEYSTYAMVLNNETKCAGVSIFFEGWGGDMRLSNWRGSNGQSSCCGRAHVLVNSSEMLQNAS